MAIAKKEGRNGVDRWTSNGYGIKVTPNTPEQQKVVDRINKEVAEKQKKAAAKKTTKKKVSK